MLPVPVLEKAANEMLNYEGSGMSVMEMSHRSKVYDGIITRSTLLGKIMDSLVWGLDKDLAGQWVEDALWPVPADFAGKLLDIKTPTLIQFNDSTAAYLQAG